MRLRVEGDSCSLNLWRVYKQKIAEVRDVRWTYARRCFPRGARRRMDERLLEDLGAFGVQIDQWMVAAQDAGEWFKAVKQGGGFDYDELDCGWESWSKGRTRACNSYIFEQNGKDQIESSPKQVYSCWFACYYLSITIARTSSVLRPLPPPHSISFALPACIFVSVWVCFRSLLIFPI